MYVWKYIQWVNICNLLLDYEDKIRGHFIHFWFKKKKTAQQKNCTTKKTNVKLNSLKASTQFITLQIAVL